MSLIESAGGLRTESRLQLHGARGATFDGRGPWEGTGVIGFGDDGGDAAAGQRRKKYKNASLFGRRRTYMDAMPGVGKLLKQAQKMQRSIESLQAQLDAREIEVAAGGGAVKVKVSASGKFLALSLDPEFLKEDAKMVSDTLLAAIQDAAKQAKELNDSEMQKVTSAFQMPGIF
ncbi:MAG TPA: YbaB/EbfC family nucleoid-associated protein [Opitutaceae bacterium]